MTATLLSSLRDAGPPLANHLWQSTAFVVAISLLTFLFGKNRARVRYGLWFVASVKFLIPFSALIALGSVIPLSSRAVPVLQPPLVSAVQVIDQPFTRSAVTQVVNAQSFLQSVEAWLPAALILTWALGFAVMLLAWYARWRQVSKILERAVPAEGRREIEILRRVENDTTARARTRFLISSDLMEPGVCGIFRPVLLWPTQLSDRLEDAHLEAILAHEVAHVHRLDNLAALIPMAVEAIFWFHPFVWWIERKVIEERERACDEAVLQSGSRAEIYADSLLKVSRFCAELSLPCVSGVTGADLSKRIRSIMACRVIDLGMGKRLMLTAFAMAAVAGPVAFGLMQEASHADQILHATGPLPSFEVASIKPNHSGSDPTTFRAAGHGAPMDRFIATNVTIKMLIGWAFAGNSLPLPTDLVSGGPSWIDSEHYDIEAKLGDSQVAALYKSSDLDRILQIRRMAQALLADRFKLVVNDTTVIRPVYALVVAKGGPRLKEKTSCITPSGATLPPLPPRPGAPRGSAPQARANIISRPGEMIACELPIKDLARALQLDPQLQLGRPVVDQTGLTGYYTFDLKWTPDLNSQGAMAGPSPSAEAPSPDASGPSIFTAIQEQLGLKLESTKGPEEAIAIVRVEKPSEN